MAGKRRVAVLPSLSEATKQRLQRAGLRTVEEVLRLPPLDAMKQLNLSADQTQELLAQLYNLCVPAHTTAWALLREGRGAAVPLGHPPLDALLAGGLQPATLTELAGPSGVGKTQWCLQATVRCILGGSAPPAASGVPTPPPRAPASVIYIDTEAAFRPQRLVELLQRQLPEEKHGSIPDLLSRVLVHQPDSLTSLDNIVVGLEAQVMERGVGLVVVDSIASLARKQFPPPGSGSGGDCGGAWRRVLLMAGWAAKLKTMAANTNIVVLVTNQVTSRNEGEYEEEDSNNLTATVPIAAPTTAPAPLSIPGSTTSSVPAFAPRRFVTPALGNTWSHFVNTRLILQYTAEPGVRQVVVAKSPVAPFASFHYEITSDGVHVKGPGWFSYSGNDPGYHRIQVEAGPVV